MSNPIYLDKEQKRSFGRDGFLHLPSFYSTKRMDEMRSHFHDLITETKIRPKNMSYSFMPEEQNYGSDPFNPLNVVGIMDQSLADDYWFDQFTEPSIVSVMSDLLGPNVDFHNGKIRNKPPGFFCSQGWHQDWPYELHSKPDLAAAITYLDSTQFEAGATEAIRGSHLLGEWETQKESHTIDPENIPEKDRVVIEANMGDVLIIHVLVVHRAGHNYTKQGRHAIINEYKTAETIDAWNNRCAFAGLPLTRNKHLLLPRVRTNQTL